MLRTLRARADKDRGFTLIELMIVVLIVAILIAIGIPTFLGARTKGQDRAAQVDLRQSLLTAKSYYTDTESFAATAAELVALEPTIAFDAAIANSTSDVVGFTGTATSVIFAKQSKSGTWFCISETASTGTTYDEGANLAAVDTVAECVGQSW
jgi:type IV pilus assembly protein PilA